MKDCMGGDHKKKGEFGLMLLFSTLLMCLREGSFLCRLILPSFDKLSIIRYFRTGETKRQTASNGIKDFDFVFSAILF